MAQRYDIPADVILSMIGIPLIGILAIDFYSENEFYKLVLLVAGAFALWASGYCKPIEDEDEL